VALLSSWLKAQQAAMTYLERIMKMLDDGELAD